MNTDPIPCDVGTCRVFFGILAGEAFFRGTSNVDRDVFRCPNGHVQVFNPVAYNG